MLDVKNLIKNPSFIEKYRQKGPFEPHVNYNGSSKHSDCHIKNYFMSSSLGSASSYKIVFVAVDFMDGTHQVFYENEIEKETSHSGCYVATCVYGSYDCPEVWTLRRYRDNTLGTTWCGRLFVRTYYAISPTLVKWFGKTKWFKKLWRGKLDRMVKRLQERGVENTPYQDKEW